MVFGEFSLEMHQLDELDDHVARLEKQNETQQQRIKELEEKLKEQELNHQRVLTAKHRDLKTAVKIIENGRQILRDERDLRTKCEEKVKGYEEELIRINSLLVCREIEKASYELKLIRGSAVKDASSDEHDTKTDTDWFKQYALPSRMLEEENLDSSTTSEKSENPGMYLLLK